MASPNADAPVPSAEGSTHTELQLMAQLLVDQVSVQGWECVASNPSRQILCQSEQRLYCLLYPPRPPLTRLLAPLRLSHAQRAQTNCTALLIDGFPAPKPIARGTLTNGTEYLFLEKLPGDSVKYWLRYGLAGRDPASLAMRRALLRDLGAFIGRLHATGYLHGNLSTKNILTIYRGGRFCFALLDNVSVRLCHPVPGADLLAELLRLNHLEPCDLTLTDRWRFFTAWRQQHVELGHLEARLLATEIHRHSQY